jgi:membrane-associated phospholipid phosphatase
MLALGAVVSPTTARASDPPMAPDQHFLIDPVADVVLTAGGAGVAALTGLILSTGEIVPTLPGPTSNLLSFDRIAVTQTIDPNASTYSNYGLWLAVGYAAVDPILSGLRFGWDATLVDYTMYAESLSITLAITDVTKVAVRRPRPIDYINCNNPARQADCKSTDLQLSFFSGHSSTVAAATATATYLAFVRSPDSPRPWITLGLGTALTAFVSYERVRSGAHFLTDVVAGSMAGAAIGVLVPHMHRYPRGTIWIGLTPADGGGAVASVSGIMP